MEFAKKARLKLLQNRYGICKNKDKLQKSKIKNTAK